jgi:RimJ/RimL family protein N-acetyltransferase
MSPSSAIPQQGVEVATYAAPRPEPVVLKGQWVTLVPLSVDHADDLFEAACKPGDDGLWAYLFDAPYRDRSVFREAIATKAALRDPLTFAIIDNATQQAKGYCALMRIEPVHRVIEIGNILFSSALQRKPAATETMYLMARHVFDDLGYRRYEWKCNDLNVPSKRAAIRLGFSYEGLFRQHMIVKGHSRDTAWFSMLDQEWPARKAAFEQWLSPDNFDANGLQRVALSELNGVGSS